MLISHNWLKSYYKNTELVPEPEKVCDLFTMHAFEIESMEQRGDDYIYDIIKKALKQTYFDEEIDYRWSFFSISNITYCKSKDNNKQNNTIENLILLTQKEHANIHMVNILNMIGEGIKNGYIIFDKNNKEYKWV
jgi:hypothetical protein